MQGPDRNCPLGLFIPCSPGLSVPTDTSCHLGAASPGSALCFLGPQETGVARLTQTHHSEFPLHGWHTLLETRGTAHSSRPRPSTPTPARLLPFSCRALSWPQLQPQDLGRCHPVCLRPSSTFPTHLPCCQGPVPKTHTGHGSPQHNAAHITEVVLPAWPAPRAPDDQT